MSLSHAARVADLTRRQTEWEHIGNEWEMRFRGELNDLLDDSSMANSYCTKEGKRLFFLCDSAKVPVVDIGRRKFDLPAARRRREKAQADKSTEGGKGSLGKRLGEQATLPRLSIIKRETPAKLLQRSFMKPTLKGDSFGPGDAHRRAMSNYYHVQDSLPPKPLRPNELKGSIMLYYDNTAPPPMPRGGEVRSERPLLDGVTGKPLPFPLVVDPKTEEQSASLLSMPVKALTKNTSEPKKRVLVEGRPKTLSHYEREKMRSQHSASIFDSIMEAPSASSQAASVSAASSVAGAGSVASSHTSATKRSGKGGKTMTAKQIEESMSEMETLLNDMDGKDFGPGESWASAGMAIKNHFHLLKHGQQNAGKDLYKDEPITRFYSRFMKEGPRRGDGCFETDPKVLAKMHLEALFHKAKMYANAERVNKHNTDDLAKMKSTAEQRRIIKDLRREMLKAQRRLMSSEIWQLKHGKVNRKKDKRDFSSLWDEESEEEEPEPEPEKPPTREEMWLGDTNLDLFAPKEEEKKPKTPKEEYSDRQIVTEAMGLLEEVLMEYVYDFMGEELEEMERLGMIACVIDVQARFRGYVWRRDNYKIVNRLKMRSVSRSKRFAKRRSDAAAAGGDEGENDQGGGEGGGEGGAKGGAEPWVDPETGEVWQTLQDDDGNWYYLNQTTGESRWA